MAKPAAGRPAGEEEPNIACRLKVSQTARRRDVPFGSQLICFEFEVNLEVSLARLQLETLVKNQRAQDLFGEEVEAYGALPHKIPPSAKRGQVRAGDVNHKARAAAVALDLEPPKLRIRNGDLSSRHRANGSHSILGERQDVVKRRIQAGRPTTGDELASGRADASGQLASAVDVGLKPADWDRGRR